MFGKVKPPLPTMPDGEILAVVPPEGCITEEWLLALPDGVLILLDRATLLKRLRDERLSGGLDALLAFVVE